MTRATDDLIDAGLDNLRLRYSMTRCRDRQLTFKVQHDERLT